MIGCKYGPALVASFSDSSFSFCACFVASDLKMAFQSPFTSWDRRGWRASASATGHLARNHIRMHNVYSAHSCARVGGFVATVGASLLAHTAKFSRHQCRLHLGDRRLGVGQEEEAGARPGRVARNQPQPRQSNMVWRARAVGIASIPSGIWCFQPSGDLRAGKLRGSLGPSYTFRRSGDAYIL